MTQPAHTEEPTYATHDIEICIVGVCSAADVAQLAEQLICNQQVVGSTPVVSSNKPACRHFSIQSTNWWVTRVAKGGRL